VFVDDQFLDRHVDPVVGVTPPIDKSLVCMKPRCKLPRTCWRWEGCWLYGDRLALEVVVEPPVSLLESVLP